MPDEALVGGAKDREQAELAPYWSAAIARLLSRMLVLHCIKKRNLKRLDLHKR